MGVWGSISGHGGVILEALGVHLDVLFGVLGALGAHLDVLFWVPGPLIAKKGPRTLNVRKKDAENSDNFIFQGVLL